MRSSAWEAAAPTLLPRMRHAAAFGNGQLFVLGGATLTTSVETARQGL